MSEQHLIVKTENGVCHIQFNRPELKNAITQQDYADLANAISTADSDDRVRVLLLSGVGEDFCSGNDLTEFDSGENLNDHPALKFMLSMLYCEKPVIAAVSGAAVGIGTTMLLHCDLVYADTSATFLLPFNNFGLCAEFGSSFLLPQLVGQTKAMDLILMGEAFDAYKAKELGIVVDVQSDVISYAFGQANKMAKKPPGSTRLNKQLLQKAHKPLIEQIIREELNHLLTALQGSEAREAVKAFREKRAPNFSKPF